MAGDDLVSLFLSTDDTAANKSLIASVPSWTGFREWTKHASQVSAARTLTAGFTLAGAGLRPVLLRGIGPTLGAFGVAGTLADPALIAEGEKTQRYIDYIDASETLKAVRKAIGDITPEQKKRVQTILSLR